MLETIRTLWDYNFWAQDRFFAAIDALTEEEFTRDLGDGVGSIRDKLAHVCGADIVWIRRLEGEQSPPFPKVDEFSDKAALLHIWHEVRGKYRRLLASLSPEDLSKSCSYKNLKGLEFNTPISEILLHVSNHGVYHRGQAASLLRRIKGAPPVTDLIEYFRSL